MNYHDMNALKTISPATIRTANERVMGSVNATQPPQVEVHREIEILGTALDYLEQCVAELNTRLYPLMLPETPSQDTSGGPVEATAGSLIGQSLQNLRARVNQSADRLNLALGRLAV